MLDNSEKVEMTEDNQSFVTVTPASLINLGREVWEEVVMLKEVIHPKCAIHNLNLKDIVKASKMGNRRHPYKYLTYHK